jgi:deazaflavin-dependent oxidoreductase (nitroreductase family)
VTESKVGPSGPGNPRRSVFASTVLKNTLNRLTLRIARGKRGPFSIVTHIGRKSGKTFETPIIIQPADGGFMIELTYGDQVQWYRNVVAAGGCELTYRGAKYVVDGIAPVDASVGLAAFPGGQRRLLKLLRREHFVLFRTTRPAPLN